ncbi:hypothetical protein [Paraclostridium bifermentans]|uniref:hypothetical protein n=1 Tax=Paraclostridium bifermentans TaxID=1490 RepID=UPI00374E5BDE
MNDLNKIVKNFLDNFNVEMIHESMCWSHDVARDFSVRLEDEPFIVEEIPEMIEEVLSGERNFLHPCVILPVVKRKLEYGSTPLEIFRFVCNAWNTSYNEFFMLVINPTNARGKQEISKYFYDIANILMSNEIDEILTRAEQFINEYNLAQINFDFDNSRRLSPDEIVTLNTGDIVLFKEKFVNFETYVSGMIGSGYDGVFNKGNSVMANDMFDGNRVAYLVNSEEAEVYLLDIRDIKANEFKEECIKQLIKYNKN